MVKFDTDSEMFGVDNRCSGCISHIKSDFLGDLRSSDRTIRGLGGTQTFHIKTGTLK